MGNDNSINKRLNIPKDKLIYDDFPNNARIAVVYLFKDLIDKSYIWHGDSILLELNRTGRLTNDEFGTDDQWDFYKKLGYLLDKLNWVSVLIFLERSYERLLTSVSDFHGDDIVTIKEVREYFSDEINLILIEENLGLEFIDGKFSRKYKFQTQKLINQASKVLEKPELEQVRKHYKKALDFFNQKPNPDSENCVKEAICALEACIEILFSVEASKEFDKALSKIQGNTSGKVPPPIVEGIKKLHSYRGSSQGVAHASMEGNKVSPSEAELVLSLVAAYITYLDDICIREADFPF